MLAHILQVLLQLQIGIAVKFSKRIVNTFNGIFQNLLLVAILLPAALFMTVKLPAVQTYLVHQLTQALSEKAKTKISIGSVSYAFFNKLDINKIYVEDHGSDTLLYVDRLRLSISSIGLTTHVIQLGNLKLSDGEFNLRIANGTTNIQQIVEALSQPKPDSLPKTKKSLAYTLSVKSVTLDNFKFTMQRTPMQVYEDHNRINFTNLRVDSIHLNIDDVKLAKDTLFFTIAKLQFNERSGFKMHNLSANGYVCSKQAMLKNICIRDEFSDLRMGYFSLNFAGGSQDLKDFLNKIRMDAQFSDVGYVSFRTLNHFAPSFSNVTASLCPRGFVTGTVANLKSDSLYIHTLDGGVSALLKFRMTGLPHIDETSIYADVKDMHGYASSVVTLCREVMGARANALQPYIMASKNIGFKGKFTGLYNDFVANGKLQTDVGSLVVDALFTSSKTRGTTFKGRFSGLDFYIGSLLSEPIVGRSSFNVGLQGNVSPKGRLNTMVDGTLAQLELNGYRYSNILMAGRLESNSFDGLVSVNDPNLKLDFSGKIDNLQYTDSIPIFKFRADIKHANLCKLNINKRDTVSLFNGLLQANFVGRNWNNGNGYISLSRSSYTDAKGVIELGDILFSVDQAIRAYHMKLESEYLDADFKGTGNPAQMAKDARHLMARYLPSVFTDTLANADDGLIDTYRISVKTKKTGDIARIFVPEFYIAENSTVDVVMDDTRLLLDAQSEKLYYKQYQAKQPLVKVECSDSVFRALVTGRELNNSAALFMRNLNISSSAKGDSISTIASYDNKTRDRNAARIAIRTLFAKPNGHTTTELKINPSQVFLNNIAWNISGQSILFDSARMAVSNFEIGDGKQQLLLNGAYSENVQDTLSLSLNSFSLAQLSYFLHDLGYDKVDGNISGKATLVQRNKQPLFFADMRIMDVSTNGHLLGNIGLRSFWNNEREQLELGAAVVNGVDVLLNASGRLIPKQSYLNFSIKTTDFPLVQIEPMLKGVITGINGGVSSQLTLEGTPGKYVLTGDGTLNNAGLTVDYLKTRYTVNGKIRSVNGKISLTDGIASDGEGNTATVDAYAAHNHFKRFRFNMDFHLNNLKCLNTTALDNDLFYGTAYGTGDVNISGPITGLDFTIAAKTNKRTVIYIPLMTAMASKTGSELLSFYTPPVVNVNEDEQQFFSTVNPSTVTKKNDLNLRIDLEVTKDAEVQLIIDPRTDDVLKGAGSGQLKMTISPAQSLFKTYGTYTIDNGSYGLSIPNLNFLRKEFDIDKGGSITFNGDMSRMYFNLSAAYDKVIRTSLEPLLPLDASVNQKAKYPVTCRIKINGGISDVAFKPSVEVANIDSDTEAKVQSVMNTDEKVLRQFLSLLALGQFTPEQSGAQSNNNSGINAGLANLSEVISSRLGSIFTELHIPLDVGVSYKTNASGTSDEIGVDFSYRINDKIVARGNVGNTKTVGNEGGLTGDFDFEYLWKPSVTLKAFSHSTDPYTDLQGGSRYGGAISYQNRFATFKDLWNSIVKSKKKRAAEAEEKQVQPKDTTARNQADSTATK